MTEKFRLTREIVLEAADALYEEGEQPSTVKVFQRIGRGSMTTIQKYLKEWRPEAGSGEKESVEMPPEVRDAVGRFAFEMWRRLWAVTQGELEAVRRNATDEVTRVQGEFAQMAEMIDSLQGKLEEVTGNRDSLRDQFEKVQGELREMTGRNGELETRHTGLLADKLRLEEKVQELDRALSKTQERLALVEGRVESLTSENISLKAEVDRRIEEIAKTREERDAVRGEVLAASKIEENFRRELKKEEERGKKLTEKADLLSRQLTEEAAKRATLEERLSQMEGKP